LRVVAGVPKETPSGAPRRHVARLARTARRREGPRGDMAAELSRRRTALAGTTRVLLGSLAPTPRRQAGPAHAAARVSGARGQSGQLPRAGRRAAHAARPYRPRIQQSQRPYRPCMLQGSRPKVAAGLSLAGGAALAMRMAGGGRTRRSPRAVAARSERRGKWRLGLRQGKGVRS